MVNPIEVNYQPSRTVYCFRVELTAGTTPKVYNTITELYETFNISNWTQYVVALTESIPGYYRADPPTPSLDAQATEIFYEQAGGSPASSDAPAIANGNSQGVNIATINGVQTDIGAESPTQEVGICNLALKHLGQGPITSFADDSEAARSCDEIFAATRDEVLRRAAWKFASVIAELVAADSAITVIGWGYVYVFPTDSVLIRRVYSDNANRFDLPVFPNTIPFPVPTSDPQPIEYRVVYSADVPGQVIACNASPAYIEYTGRVVDPALFDPLYKEALVYKLAAKLAVILNGAKDVAKEMLNQFEVALSEAARQNAIETGIKQRPKSTFIDVR